MRMIAVTLALGVTVAAAACGSNETTTTPVPGDPATDTTSQPTTPPATDPPEIDPLATDPAADLPTSEPPPTDPPASDPLATDPPATDPPTGPPTEGTAVVYGGSGTAGFAWIPLGWWDGTAWNQAGYADDGSFVVPPAASFPSISASSLDLAGAQLDGDQVVTGLTAGPDDFYCVGDEMGPIIDLPVDVPTTEVSLAYDAIAVTGDWPLQPRPVTQVGLDAPIYAEIGAALLAGETPTNEQGEVVQVVRADLDGDGAEEVVVTYEYITEPNFGAEHDFSLVYVRYPSADGTVVDEPLRQYVLDDPTEFPTVGRITVAAIADLNGDGIMEVVTRDAFWESGGIEVFVLDDERLVSTLGGGCGV